MFEDNQMVTLCGSYTEGILGYPWVRFGGGECYRKFEDLVYHTVEVSFLKGSTGEGEPPFQFQER